MPERGLIDGQALGRDFVAQHAKGHAIGEEIMRAEARREVEIEHHQHGERQESEDRCDQRRQNAARSVLVGALDAAFLHQQRSEESRHDEKRGHAKAVDEGEDEIENERIIRIGRQGHRRRRRSQVEPGRMQDDPEHHHAAAQRIEAVVPALVHRACPSGPSGVRDSAPEGRFRGSPECRVRGA